MRALDELLSFVDYKLLTVTASLDINIIVLMIMVGSLD